MGKCSQSSGSVSHDANYEGYCQLKEEALDRTVWRNRFGRGFGPVVWQITDDDDYYYYLQDFDAVWFTLKLEEDDSSEALPHFYQTTRRRIL